MCEFSLEAIRSRRAKFGDKVVLTHFEGTCSKGFASQNDLETAVCLFPHTELVIGEVPEGNINQHLVSGVVAEFVKLKKPLSGQGLYRDAIILPGDPEHPVILQALPEGLAVSVGFRIKRPDQEVGVAPAHTAAEVVEISDETKKDEELVFADAT